MPSVLSEHVLFQFLHGEGQIIMALLDGPKTAGEIYSLVNISQPIASKKLARLQDEKKIECQRDIADRRIVWYALTTKYMNELANNIPELVINGALLFAKGTVASQD